MKKITKFIENNRVQLGKFFLWIDTTKQSQPVDNNKKLLMIIWTHERSPNQIVSEKTAHLSQPSFCILPWWISHLRLAASRSDIYSLYIYSWCCCLPYLLPLTKNPINKFSSYIFCMGETIFGSYNWFGSRQKKEQADDSGDHVTYPQGVNKGGGGMKLFLKNILGFLSLFYKGVKVTAPGEFEFL